jgi:hypothetical protein
MGTNIPTHRTCSLQLQARRDVTTILPYYPIQFDPKDEDTTYGGNTHEHF